ncbi:MAG: ATP-dependent sacrificial sulfur transferase LarE [Ignavibacteriae bacterium]|nr:MAG: ATP-dependent sacrificial sulfur transferase LarE [Ignavibacteriota bacterium]
MNRYEDLKDFLKKYKRVIVAFSGGIDSYFVLKAAVDSLGKENVLAVTGDSPSLKSAEKHQTNILASEIGAEHKIIFTEEMENPEYINNPTNRCFFCKDELFTKLEGVKNELKYDVILDGTNHDDLSDYRPGFRASRNHGITSPLVDLKFSKNEIRETAKELGLTIWNKPSSPCLSSRIPYGQKVTVEKLSMIEKAEEVLMQLGFNEFRVRHFEIQQNGNEEKLKLAKVDISLNEMKNVLNEDIFSEIHCKLNEIGYDFVTLDMGGLKSGSLNVNIKSSQTNN